MYIDQIKTPIQGFAFLLVILCCISSSVAIGIQQDPQDDQAFPIPDDEGQINLTGQGDLNLSRFVRWLAVAKDIEIFDDGKLDGQTSLIKFYGGERFHIDEMFELVQAVLRTRDLAIVRSEVEGWYRVVSLASTRSFAPQGDANDLKEFENAEYVTAIFSLEHESPENTSSFLKGLMNLDSQDKAGTSMTTIAGRKILIVTSTAKRLRRIKDTIERFDQPVNRVQPIFHDVIHLEVDQLVAQLQEILAQTSGTQTQDGARTNQSGVIGRLGGLHISSDKRTNRLILIGETAEVENALELVRQLDVELGLKLRRYQFEFVPATRIDELIKQSFGLQDESAVERVYQSTTNADSNQLVVTAREEIHLRIEELRKQLDVPSQKENQQSPIKFYRLKNVKAIDILDTLQSIERRVRENRSGSSRRNNRLTGITTRDGFGVNGPNSLGSGADGQITPLNFQREDGSNGGVQNPFGANSNFGAQNQFPGSTPFDTGQLGSRFPEFGGGRTQNLIPGEAQITIDETNNMLIVAAEPAVQQLYAEMIEKLDVRRPQVLIEVNVVTLTDNDDFNLGIEIGGGDRAGDTRLFAFTSFGLSETDGAAGTLGLSPGLGFNGTLVDPDVADIVLRALARHRKSRVIAAPRILVNDNATGLLSSVAEVPFTSINAGNTVATTSFAGFAQAGTTISVTPQISDDDYLNLEFDVLINDFTGVAADGSPPPRNTDQVTSEVSIPDGHTVIVGGLKRRRLSDDVQGLPIIEHIPLLKDLTNSQTKASEGQRLFVFIKPIILRDDKFQDLRFLSERAQKSAGIPDDFPTSSPVLIR